MRGKKAGIIAALILLVACSAVCVASAFGYGPQPLVQFFSDHRGSSIAQTASTEDKSNKNKSIQNKSARNQSAQQTPLAASSPAKASRPGANNVKNAARPPHSRVMRIPIEWRQPSQTTPYPHLGKIKKLWIRVSIDKTGHTSWTARP